MDDLEAYAEEFDLPVQLQTRGVWICKEDGRFLPMTTGDGVRTENMVVATGAFHVPEIPPVAGELPADLFTGHSSEFSNPAHVHLETSWLSGPTTPEHRLQQGSPQRSGVGGCSWSVETGINCHAGSWARTFTTGLHPPS